MSETITSDVHEFLASIIISARQAQVRLGRVDRTVEGVVRLLQVGPPPGQPGRPLPAGTVDQRVTQSRAAEQVLREAGRPLTTTEVVDGLVKLGVCSATASKRTVAGSVFKMLCRTQRTIERVGPGTWALKEWQGKSPQPGPTTPANGTGAG